MYIYIYTHVYSIYFYMSKDSRDNKRDQTTI